MSPKRLILHLEKMGLVYLVAFALAAFGIATYQGYLAGSTLWDSFVATAMAPNTPPKGWTLAAHLLATFVILWAAAKVYMTAVGLKWDTYRARYFSNGHVIIVAGMAVGSSGLEGSGAVELEQRALAIDLAESLALKQSVVLCIPDIKDGIRTRLWAAGVTVLSEDLPLASLLGAAGVRRARTLIVMRDAYEDNIALVRRAVAPDQANKTLECKCMVEPLSFKHTFNAEQYFDAATLPRIRIFNQAEMIARQLLNTHPADLPVAQSQDQGVHVLLVGFGSIGQAVMVQLARIGHYRSGIRPKVTVVGRNVSQHWNALRKAYPTIDQWLQVEPIEMGVEDVAPNDVDKWLHDERPVTAAYVCMRNEIANLRIAKMVLTEALKDQEAQTEWPLQVVAMDPPGGSVLSHFVLNGDHQGQFHLFSPSQNGLGVLIGEVDDRRARLLHEDYCAKNPSSSSNEKWEDLPETLRDANRGPSDHFEVKLRAIGLVLAPKSRQEAAEISEDEMTLLARMEHARWWADRSLNGWTYGPDRDNGQKIHPNMVPFEELSEADQKKDKDNVQQMIDIMDQEGKTIVGSSR